MRRASGIARRLASCVLLAATWACGAPDPTARNLVLVSLDTLRADRLGVYGYSRDTSPGLDAFAREAFVFEWAQSAANATAGAHHAIFQSRPASRAVGGAASAPTLAALLRERGWRTAALTDGGTMSRAMGFARGFEHFDDGNHGLAESGPKALAWLDAVAAEGAPFYLLLHSFDVHLPYDPPPPWDERFGPDYRGPVTGPRTLPLLRGVRHLFGERAIELGPADRERVSALYDGEIAKTDALLAPLLARLSAADLRDDTLVVVLSDHGEEFWEHGSVLHSHTLYQELLRVPLLLRVPAWRERAARIATPVSMLDVLPTLLELLGLEAPPDLHGRSLVPLLRDPEASSEPAPLYSEGYPYGRSQQSVAVGRLKLIRTPASGRVELFDLDADPGERRDLSESLSEERSALLALLDRALPGDAAPPADPLERPGELDEQTRRRLRELGYID